MEHTDYRHISKVTSIQEEKLRFDTFNARTAWELGSFMVERMYEKGVEMSISIRRPGGCILFQHCTEKTNLNNQNWMRRKFNTVVTMERCSYGCWADANITGETAEFHGLSASDYVFCGGGFPIRLKTGEMVAVIIVSNLPHEQDHQFVVDGLADWLGVTDLPR